MSGLRISKEFGLNPSVQKCFCCGKDMGLVLFGTSWKDENGKTAEAPMHFMGREICDDCKKVINEGGAFFIECRDGEGQRSPKNPYRTGRLVAIKMEKAKELFSAQVEPKGINFMEHTVFEQVFGQVLKAEQGKEEPK